MINDTDRIEWTTRAARQLIRWRYPLALIGLVTFAFGYPISRRLDFDRRIESLFAADDPDLRAYQDLKDAFGGNAVVLLVYHDPTLNSKIGIDRNREITRTIEALPGVTDVLSTARLNDAMERFRPSFSVSEIPNLFRQDDPVAQGFDQIFAGYTHSADHHRAAVVALLAPNPPPETIESLKRIAGQLGSQSEPPVAQEVASEAIRDAVLVGEPVLIHDGLSLIERDGDRLATTTIALLSIVVVVALADLRFVILTALTIFWSVVVTRAVMVGLAVQLSLVSSVLTAIVTVVAVTAVLHLGVRYRAGRWRGESTHIAAANAVGRLLRPIFWTCATDAAGFIALSASRIVPIQQFGLMIAVASMAVFVSILLFAPCAMALPGTRHASVLSHAQRRLTSTVRRACLVIAGRSVSRAKSLGVMALGIGVLACLGLGRLETDNSFLNNFRDDSSIARAYREVETHFGGAGVWDVVVDAPLELTSDYLDQVRELERRLREIDVGGARLTKVLSVADAEAVVQRSRFAALLPASSRLSFMYVALPGFFDALLSKPDGQSRQLRIMLRSREQLEPDQKNGLIAEVTRVVRQQTDSSDWKASVGDSKGARVTGYHILMSRLIDQLIGDQWRCFAASALLVWVLLVVATRSLRLASAALIPNLLPVLAVLALVGALGGRINMGAAMIAAVSIGISIDGSVHLLLNYQRHRRGGHAVRRSTRMAAGDVGVPVLLATCALVLGFGALATSDFVPTATFGLLVAMTLALGTLVNLTLLPAFVVMVERKEDSLVAH